MMWLACHTQEEIAEAVDVPTGTIPGWEKEFLEKLEVDNSRNSPNFDPPIYNVWKQQRQPTIAIRRVIEWRIINRERFRE